MMVLAKGEKRGLKINPRWPSSKVLIEGEVFFQLAEIQSKLPRSTQLMVTRGYESNSSNLGCFRWVSRWLGIRVFCFIYPARKEEVDEIFCSNGHDLDGCHIDVSIIFNGGRLRLLPFGVFTSLPQQHLLVAKHYNVIYMVKRALNEHGFKIHSNQTESMQIHCDYKY